MTLGTLLYLAVDTMYLWTKPAIVVLALVVIGALRFYVETVE